ncbi:amidohydrolase family protein [Streptomyces meridianus]|uniref:Amidohydrolase n=1 Tax=Streptomyces meridianus TaxID=2938945 RepID=A0ABT0XEF6_9ACTN|nr:amidohydrolase family protein [Streptomyces meridianus]MCM2580157.1 amidohydrolase [Streptomyces meridianus]
MCGAETPGTGIPPAAESARVAAFRERLGLDALIDVHTHFMPDRVLRKVWAYFDGAGPLFGRPWPIAYRHEEEERLAILRGFGVRAFTAMVYPHKPQMAEWLNAWAADFAHRTPDCLRTATFFPEPEAASYVRAAVDAGAQVFKAHIQVGDYDPNDPLLEPVWGLLAETGVPIVVHCGSGPAPGKHTGPEPIALLLARHPRLRLIIAHMGLPEYRDFLALALRHPGVHLDTTMAFTDFSESSWPFPLADRPRLAEVGDRILFGSDFPNIPYPYAHALEVLAGLGLGDDWLRAVCHDNAARLLAI